MSVPDRSQFTPPAIPPDGSAALREQPEGVGRDELVVGSRKSSGETVSSGLVALLLLAVALLMLQSAGMWPFGKSRLAAIARAITPRGELTSDEQTNIEVFRSVSPSVVHITSLASGRLRLNMDPVDIPQGTGSGFVWDEQGHVVTNLHVVQNAERTIVRLADGSEWPATLAGIEADKDLAVLKIEAPADRLTPIPIGESASLLVGQRVFAIGNPFGLDQTLTTGVIGGLGRQIAGVSGRPIEGVIQTDAAINPGNSGGPLLDSSGRLIGVNTQIAGKTGNSVGIGFAVPVDIVNDVVPQLIDSGRVEKGSLGIGLAPDWFNQQARRQLHLKLGLALIQVVPGGAGAQAGLVPTVELPSGDAELGDLLIELGGLPLAATADVAKVMAGRRSGEKMRLKYLRAGRLEEIDIVLQPAPSVR